MTWTKRTPSASGFTQVIPAATSFSQDYPTQSGYLMTEDGCVLATESALDIMLNSAVWSTDAIGSTGMIKQTNNSSTWTKRIPS